MRVIRAQAVAGFIRGTRCIAAAALVTLALHGCGADEGQPLSNESTSPAPAGGELIARFVHITDEHVVDEESPARFTMLAHGISTAWRPQESYSTQLLDGTIRAINALHETGMRIDFVLSGGDTVDNVQSNEVSWFLTAFDGGLVDPLSGVDDRPEAERGPVLLDPNAPFEAEGLYRSGLHGDLPSIPWYAVPGNHDRFATGIFPLVRRLDGGLLAPLPGNQGRIGAVLPSVLVPEGAISYGRITPARPGPPDVGLFEIVTPNPDRRYLGMGEIVDRYWHTATGPAGHGFQQPSRTWFSVSPVPGLRVIGLDTSAWSFTAPGSFCDGGVIGAEQAEFLRGELARGEAAGDVIVVLTHHPSSALLAGPGAGLTGNELRAMLNACPAVVAHLAGHNHRNRVWDRGGYVEIETSSVIDWPQEARLIEIWRVDGGTELRYSVFSHLYEGAAFETLANDRLPGGGSGAVVFDDPYLPMRHVAAELAREHAATFGLLGRTHNGELLPEDRPEQASDRDGCIRLRGTVSPATCADLTE